MHMRRALLLFALVLGLTALAASLAPAPPADQSSSPKPPPPSAAQLASEEPVQVMFQAGTGEAKPPRRRVDLGTRVIVTVASPAGGEATIPGLGRIDTVTPFAPAHFDLLLSRPGSYDVAFAAPNEPPTVVGTLVADS